MKKFKNGVSKKKSVIEVIGVKIACETALTRDERRVFADMLDTSAQVRRYESECSPVVVRHISELQYA